MTSEQQNKAIAELCGWTECEIVDGIVIGKPPQDWTPIDCYTAFYTNDNFAAPNFCQDLNAMHLAESRLVFSEKLWQQYLKFLCEQIPYAYSEYAPANIRATALLKTLGQWK